MIKNYIIELCCGSVDDCKIANQFPVDRIELNHALELGGLSPTIGTLIEAKKITTLPICCMVRPRTAGFCYTNEQFESMLIDAKLLIENGADGIVFGFLNSDDRIDTIRTKKMVDLIKSYNKEAIFHKAIENCPNMEEAVIDCINCGIDRILTSGGRNYPNIHEGFDMLALITKKYGDKIQILAGGGVRASNVTDVALKSGVNQIHMTAKHTLDDNGPYTSVSQNVLDEILKALESGLAAHE